MAFITKNNNLRIVKVNTIMIDKRNNPYCHEFLSIKDNAKN